MAAGSCTAGAEGASCAVRHVVVRAAAAAAAAVQLEVEFTGAGSVTACGLRAYGAAFAREWPGCLCYTVQAAERAAGSVASTCMFWPAG